MRRRASLLPVITLIICVLFLLSWIIMSNDFDAFDTSVSSFLYREARYSRVIMTLLRMALIYLTVMCLMEYLTQCSFNPRHYQLMKIMIGTAVVGYTAIAMIWKVMLHTVYMHLQIAAPVLHIALHFATALLVCWKLYSKSKSFEINRLDVTLATSAVLLVSKYS